MKQRSRPKKHIWHSSQIPKNKNILDSDEVATRRKATIGDMKMDKRHIPYADFKEPPNPWASGLVWLVILTIGVLVFYFTRT